MTGWSSRLVPGPAGAGYRHLTRLPPESRVVRTELADPGEVAPGSRTGLLAFTHLTDLHVLDDRSPARVEYLDRYADPDLPTRREFPHVGTYRPQDPLTTHVVEAMVQAVNDVDASPVLGRPLDWSIVTGDSTDNCQANELAWYLTLLEGGQVHPVSGEAGGEASGGVGRSGPDWFDERYWHPEGSPPGADDDRPHRLCGFPRVPGLWQQVARPFEASGLTRPWYAVYGNHDAMLQGTVPATPATAALVTAGHKPVAAASQVQALAALRALREEGPASLDVLLSGPGRPVPADPHRRFVSKSEWVGAHFGPRSRPHGHGLAGAAPGEAAYAFDAGPVRALVLDTVNPHGGWHGSLDRGQLEWLAAELRAGSSTVLDDSGRATRAGGRSDRLFVVFSHHPLETLTNGYAPEGEDRVLGAEVQQLLLRHPNVVLWVSGHVHRHWVRPLQRPRHWAVPGGLWQVSTASLIDWPQQSRVVELALNGDGTLSIFTTVLDHAAPLVGQPSSPDPLALAALSRSLSANAWQRDVTAEDTGLAGGQGDRNTELLLRAPDWT